MRMRGTVDLSDQIEPSIPSRKSESKFLQLQIRLFGSGLTQLSRQILGLQMCIPPQHPQILMPGDTRDFHDIQPFLE